MNNQELIDRLSALAIDISEAEDKATSIREIYIKCRKTHRSLACGM